MIVYVNTHDVLSTPMTSTIGPCCQRGTFSFFWWRPWPLPPSCTKRSMSTKWLLASALPNCWKLFELTWGPGWPQAASSWPGLIYLPCIICLSFAYHFPIICLSFAYHVHQPNSGKHAIIMASACATAVYSRSSLAFISAPTWIESMDPEGHILRPMGHPWSTLLWLVI